MTRDPSAARVIRDERQEDVAAVREVNVAAFPTPAEADLVDALRDAADPLVSLVAELDGVVVGHLMCSPATLGGHPDVRLMGLAPMAVLPTHQGRGVGSALVREAVARCRALGADGMIVLGHPGYYPRFGFTPASRWGITCEYEASDEAFMALELRPAVFAGRAGLARYHPVFANLDD